MPTQGNDRMTWISSYPRSGNTWVRFLIVNCLVDHEFDWDTAMNAFAFELYYYLERMRDDGWSKQDVIDKLKSVVKDQPTAGMFGDTVYMKSHNRWSDDHPFAEYTDRAILIVRNPRDVLLSGANYHNLMVDPDTPAVEYAREFIEHGGDPRWIRNGYGTWFEHYQSWTNASFPVHVVRYEDLKSDPIQPLMAMCKFLGFEVSKEDAARAAERTKIAKLRDVEHKARQAGRITDFNAGFNFFNKGKSGQSLDDLEPGLDEKFDRAFAEQMEATGYSPRARV